mgnify:CR=1 FL=1
MPASIRVRYFPISGLKCGVCSLHLHHNLSGQGGGTHFPTAQSSSSLIKFRLHLDCKLTDCVLPSLLPSFLLSLVCFFLFVFFCFFLRVCFFPTHVFILFRGFNLLSFSLHELYSIPSFPPFLLSFPLCFCFCVCVTKKTDLFFMVVFFSNYTKVKN